MTRRHRLICAGWRHWPTAQRSVVVDALDAHLMHIWPKLDGKLIVAHGHCPTGADHFADEWATACPNATPERHPADWANCGPDCPPRPHRRKGTRGEFCPLAGNRRNAHMVSLGASYSLAFPGPDVPGRPSGTRNCMRLLKAAGIECRPYPFRPTPTQLEIA